MKHILLFLFISPLLFTSCSQNPLGEKVKEPFDSNAYYSNRKFFRAVGKGVSKADNIARSKADLQAKSILAQQVQTNLRELSEQYLRDQNISEQQSDLNDQFQLLGRSVTSTTLADLRKIDEKKYYNGESYSVFIAYEIKKNAMFRFLKKKAKSDRKIEDQQRKMIIEIIDEELESLEGNN